MNSKANPLKVLLIGCGHWATYDAHLPAICFAEEQGVHVSLTIGDLGVTARSRIKNAHLPKGLNLAGTWYINLRYGWEKKLNESHDNCRFDAVIISTKDHYRYIKWALSKSIPVLVDKPLTTYPECATKGSQGQQLRQDFDELTKLAKRNGTLFMLGTQKRYQAPYRTIAHFVRTIYEHTGYPINHIYAETGDGLWWFPGEIAEQDNYNTDNISKGKLNDSGYHMLDIATWLMSHTNPTYATRVRVLASMYCPRDSATLLERAARQKPNWWSDKNCVVFGRPKNREERIVPAEIDASGDIANSIQADFFDDEGCVITQCQFRLEHELFSPRSIDVKDLIADEKLRRKAALKQRNKREIIIIKQGPFAFYKLTRLAKMRLPIDSNDDKPGSPNHWELFVAVNDSVKEVLGARSNVGVLKFPMQALPTAGGKNTRFKEDQYPTLDFFRALLKRRKINVASPVKDHGVAIALLSGAYMSGATGKPSFLDVRFSKAPDWDIGNSNARQLLKETRIKPDNSEWDWFEDKM